VLANRILFLDGVVFPGDITSTTLAELGIYFDILSLSKATVNGHCELQEFAGSFSAPRAIFTGDLTLRGTSLECNLADAQIEGQAKFTGTSFSELANFEGTRFLGPVEFSGTTFQCYTEEGTSIWNEDLSDRQLVSFRTTQFRGFANFARAQFPASVSFYRARFSAGYSFARAQFKDVSFREARLDMEQSPTNVKARTDSQSFFLATFGKFLLCKGARFKGTTSFAGTRFDGAIEFTDAEFLGDVHFESVQSIGDADDKRSRDRQLSTTKFDGTIFGGRAIFDRRTFRELADFHEATFSRPPEIFGAAFENGILISANRIGDAESIREVHSARLLRKEMQKDGAFPEYDRLLQIEQGGLRRFEDLPLRTRLLLTAYWVICDYGGSLLRPSLWFVLVQLAALQTYSSLLGRTCQGQSVPLGELIRFTFRQVFVPFSALHNKGDFIGTCQVVGSQYIGIPHTISSLVLIALVVLIIRRSVRAF